MQADQNNEYVDMLIRKDFVHITFIIKEGRYECTCILSENPQIVAQFQLMQGLVDGVAYIVNLDSCSIVGVHNFRLGEQIPLEYSYEHLDYAVLDLDDRGTRWEGSLLHGQPFGFGELYNTEGLRVFCGFLFNGQYSCYGATYFQDNGLLEYQGMFYKGKRFGYGTLHDRFSTVVYNGEWVDDMHPVISLKIEKRAASVDGLSSTLHELTIEDSVCEAMQRLHLTLMNNLEKLVIADNSFEMVTDCLFSLPSLKTLIIGNNSFLGRSVWNSMQSVPCVNGSFEVSSCPQLEELTIGAYSFLGCSKFILHGACVAFH